MPPADLSSLQPSREISPHDTMVHSGPEDYLALGRRALENVRMAARLCDKPHFPRILDLPCGHGRVLRWLRAQYDYADITACDLERTGVDFCAQTFGARGVYSQPDLRDVRFDTEFDLLWCGSLLTHLPFAQWDTILDCFERWTADCGVIVLSVQSRFFATLLARGREDLCRNIQIPRLLAQFNRDGHAYEPYFEALNGEYGISVVTPEVLLRWLGRRPNLLVRAYMEQAWGIQDVVILYKRPGLLAPPVA